MQTANTSNADLSRLYVTIDHKQRNSVVSFSKRTIWRTTTHCRKKTIEDRHLDVQRSKGTFLNH